MSRPGVGPPLSMPASQPSGPPSLPSGGGLPPSSAALTAGAIGPALGPGTSDQEKVFTRLINSKLNTKIFHPYRRL